MEELLCRHCGSYQAERPEYLVRHLFSDNCPRTNGGAHNESCGLCPRWACEKQQGFECGYPGCAQLPFKRPDKQATHLRHHHLNLKTSGCGTCATTTAD